MFNQTAKNSFYRHNCSLGVESSLDFADTFEQEKSNFFILPYAKYSYCAELLNKAYSYINTEISTLIFLIPTYNYSSQKLMTFNTEKLIEIDRNLRVNFEDLSLMREKYGIASEKFEFEYEEIFKIHLDFLKQRYPELKIIPIFFNDLKNGVITEFWKDYYDKFTICLLSNLSCGFGYNDAEILDSYTASLIEKNESANFELEQFTAFKIINEILTFAQKQETSFIRIGAVNSADFNTNFASTRGFGAWFLFKGHSAEYLKKYYKDLIFEFVKFNLRKALHFECGECFNLPSVFNQNFKISLTMEKNGYVRGVSNSLKTPEPLFLGLTRHAFGMAFSDKRFAPLKPDELEEIKISVTFWNNDMTSSIILES